MWGYFKWTAPDQILVAYHQLLMKLEKPNGNVMFDFLLFQRQEVSLSPHCRVSTAGNMYLSIHCALSSEKQRAVCSPFSRQDKFLFQRILSWTAAANRRSIGQGPTKSSLKGWMGKCFECNLLMDGSAISEKVLETEGTPVICSL